MKTEPKGNMKLLTLITAASAGLCGTGAWADEPSADDLAKPEIQKQLQAAQAAVRDAVAENAGAIEQAIAEVRDVARVDWEGAAKSYDRAKKDMAGQMKKVGLVAQAVAAAPGAAAENIYHLAHKGFGRRPAKTLIVPARAMDEKTAAAIEEDLSVMSHILDKEAQREPGAESPQTAMGIFITSPQERASDAIYVEGFGALFMLNVNFPLLEPPAKEAKKTEPAPDTTWEKAKRELFQPNEDREFGFEFKGFEYHPFGGSEVEYDSKRVENLRQALLGALKNAANIRNLKNDESVVVTAFGGGGGPGGGFGSAPKAPRISGGGSGGVGATAGGGGGGFGGTGAGLTTTRIETARGSSRRSIMTIRVKKSDIDAYAKEKLDLDDFQRKASIHTYWGTSGSGSSSFGAFRSESRR
jgi:hypothetical protein